ncbi:hypothetical protein LXA43DRAFT_373361 [Ganoderma leucocontextum]|nr:hypothetical protein LXA43DRAFT_373361 [Ganoderma leucocontextum]
MATAAVLTPRDVPTTLNYFKALNDEPPRRYVEPPEGKPSSNVGSDPQPAVVHDVRGREAEFSLDKNGFQFVRWPSVEKDFTHDDGIKERYYPEVEQILKEVTGAKRVYIFDHTVRRNPNSDLSDRKNPGPAEVVHVDQAYWASVDRVKYHLPADAARLLQSRVRIINVWRPIAHPVAHKPLALADWRTLDAANLVPVELVYPHRTGATYGVSYNPARELEWYYLGGQTPEEVALIKCYDSETDTARLTPHSAFKDAGSPADAPHRQSIEVRALVFDVE